jgi:2-phospho-L-lactate guanylyltransferase
MTATGTWCALVPQKALATAKGRIALPADQRRLLATAMLRDTVAALEATPAVSRVYLLWEDSADRPVLPGSATVRHVEAGGHSLNGAVRLGAEAARRAHPGSNLVVVPSDLPALAPAELTAFLARAARYRRAFLADADATGTSLLTVTGDAPLLPSYGPNSRDRHGASGARELASDDLPSLRRDVDDLAALDEAMRLGCGVHTTCSVLDGTSRPVASGATG